MASTRIVSLLTLLSLHQVAAIRHMTEDLDELVEHEEGESVSADSDTAEFLVTCPNGMTTYKEEGSPDQCEYTTLDLWEVDEPSLGMFNVSSEQPLYFNKKSTALNMSLAFSAEFVAALTDNDTFMTLLGLFGANEMERNATLAAEFAAWVENISETAYSDGVSDFWSGVHGFEANAYVAVLIVEKTLEHVLIYYVIELLHQLEYAAKKGTVWGQSALESFTQLVFHDTLAHTAHAAGHALHIFLHYVLTPYLVIEAYEMIETYIETWRETTESAESFVMRLVLRGDCVSKRYALSTSNMDASLLNPTVETVCGSDVSEVISNLMIRTSQTIVTFFDTVATIGRCMNPGEEGTSNKKRRERITCADRLYRPLRETRALPGQLWSALTYIAMVMSAIDDLLSTENYGYIMYEKFGITRPSDWTFSERRDLEAVENGTIDERFLVCYAIATTHRAFERSLARIEQSMRIWVQTFGRRKTAGNVWGSSWKPCKDVFYALGEEEAGRDGFCMSENMQWGDDLVAAEEISCSSPLNDVQWSCYERNRFQDAVWCKYANTFEGYEYRDFGEEDTSPCGCECCRREVLNGYMWPDMDSH